MRGAVVAEDASCTAADDGLAIDDNEETEEEEKDDDDDVDDGAGAVDKVCGKTAQLAATESAARVESSHLSLSKEGLRRYGLGRSRSGISFVRFRRCIRS